MCKKCRCFFNIDRDIDVFKIFSLVVKILQHCTTYTCTKGVFVELCTLHDPPHVEGVFFVCARAAHCRLLNDKR